MDPDRYRSNKAFYDYLQENYQLCIVPTINSYDGLPHFKFFEGVLKSSAETPSQQYKSMSMPNSPSSPYKSKRKQFLGGGGGVTNSLYSKVTTKEGICNFLCQVNKEEIRSVKKRKVVH